MKTLYLVRHAKSSWKNPELADFDRPLNKRGKRDAPFMANKMKLKGVLPDIIISSSANRAQATAKYFAEGLGYPVNQIVFKKQVYDADEQDLLHVIQKVDDDYESLMLFGHNPEFTWLANELANESLDNLPTAGVIAIQLEINSWTEVAFGSGKMLFIDYPKNYLSELPTL